MAVDYDAPRKNADDEPERIEEVHAVSTAKKPTRPDDEPDEMEVADTFELPGADLSGVDLVVEVVAQRDDEFTCTSCFLVHHRSQLAGKAGRCRDCA